MMGKNDHEPQTINDLARSVAEKRNTNGGSYNIPEFTKLYTKLIDWAKPYKRKGNYDPQCFGSAFNDAIMEAFDTYDISRDFLPLFKRVFGFRIKDENRKLINSLSTPTVTRKNTAEKTIDERNNTGESEESLRAYEKDLGHGIFEINKARRRYTQALYDSEQDKAEMDIKDKSVDVVGNTLYHIELERSFRLIADVCILKKKKYSKSPKVCYEPLFFTDNVVYNVFDTEFFDEIVQKNANKIDEAVSADFLNTLLTGKCDSVAEISNFDCRPLSDFTGNPKDAETPCCNGAPDYRVFYDHLKKANGKGISQPGFIEQRNKYYALISNKLEINYLGKKKRV